MSRSATLVIAFLMRNKAITAIEAFKKVYIACQLNVITKHKQIQVKLERDIRPNDGFIKQLAEYQQVLSSEMI